jgi:replicative DNA helicase
VPRALPTNVEVEQGFLGALLINNEILGALSGFLRPEHFSEEIHRRIFLIASSLISDGRVASPVTLKTFLGEHDVGGMTVPQYLARLVVDAPASGPDYGRAVHDLAMRRALIEVAESTIKQAIDTPVDVKPSLIASESIAALQAVTDSVPDSGTRIRSGEVASDRPGQPTSGSMQGRPRSHRKRGEASSEHHSRSPC